MLPHSETLKSTRLVLRALTPEVYRELFEVCNNDEIKEYLGLESDEEVEAEKEKYTRGMRTYKISFVYFHILLNGRIIGDCGFHTWYTLHARAEIGYGIRKEEDKNKGYMTELMPVLLRYGFETMQLHRIEAMVGTGNIASIRLLKRQGFLEEGHLRQHYLKNDVYEDSLVFALIKEEWLNIAAGAR